MFICMKEIFFTKKVLFFNSLSTQTDHDFRLKIVINADGVKYNIWQRHLNVVAVEDVL